MNPGLLLLAIWVVIIAIYVIYEIKFVKVFEW